MDNRRVITTEMLTEYRQKLIEDEKSVATIDKYMHDVERFASYCENEGVENVTKMTSITYKEKLRNSGYSGRSINAMLAAINSFFKHMGWYDVNVKPCAFHSNGFCVTLEKTKKTKKSS